MSRVVQTTDSNEFSNNCAWFGWWHSAIWDICIAPLKKVVQGLTTTHPFVQVPVVLVSHPHEICCLFFRKFEEEFFSSIQMGQL
jgi:hypothetical protein